MNIVEEGRDGASAGDASPPPALTDAQGRYALRGLVRTSYTVVAEAQRGELRAIRERVTPHAAVDLRAETTTALSGTVTGPGGPTALFSVELEGPSHEVRSFTGGSFTFRRLDPGRYTVRVGAREGSGDATVVVSAAQPAQVAITLSANAVVTGTLVDPSGAPLAGQDLALVPDAGDAIVAKLSGPPPKTAADGSFRLEQPACAYTLLVMRPGAPFLRRGIALVAGQTLALGRIAVDPAAPPRGP